MKKYFLFILLTFFLLRCTESSPETSTASKQFLLIPPSSTSITFNNQITETDSINYFTYPYLYLGAGVATADFDQDGKTDIFFTGNMVDNQLYRNLGNWQFGNITQPAGVAASGKWTTGVTLVDINNDGWLDIYTCVSGEKADKRNQLYINNQDLTFTEAAQQYGLADNSPSIQSVFFDYDKDGDLDCYVANYPSAPFGASNFYYLKIMKELAKEDSDHLYRNNGDGTFTDVSQESGIANYGLSLGISVADFNDDGWEDLYISNDFATPDRFFFNNGDGTFSNELKNTTFQTALFGMGCDAADFNNDGRFDLAQVDMTPKDNRRSKENMASMNPQAFWEMIRSGFHYQYMYNALQLNRGQVHPDSLPKFSNIARLGGMASTDWSWAPLFADLDNDGWKDLFITNGIKREVNNRDFHNAMKMKINFTQSLDSINYEDIPSEPIANYVFQNTSAAEELGFEDRSEEWKLNTKGFSHGCAFADLDNDGDLDLVVNNMDAEAGIYENELSDNNFLRIKLKGSAGNRFGIGAKVKIIASGQVQTQHLSLTRGYQSAVEPVLHFGLGKSEIVDEINIDWLDGKTAKLQNISSNQTLVLDYEKAEKSSEDPVINSSLFTRTSLSNEIIQHHENDYDDYALEPLLPYETSHLGGHLSVGDANGDGLEDFFLGNSFTHSSVLYLQTKEGQFEAQTTPFEADKNFEDMGSLFFDADKDGDLDLYVVSGGNEFSKRPDLLQDRLYINDNNQGFIRSQTALPKIIGSGGRVSAGDYDQDGDLDLFIGGRLSPANYPKPGISYLLENKGGKDLNLKFEDVTTKIAPELQEIGMVTDALWSDYDNDNDLDLIVVGEWMPITIFDNGNGQFNKSTVQQLNSASGWWYSLAQGDFDQDGDIDYIAGNLGTNYKYQASPDAPFDVYADDFDQNGRQDIVLGYYQDGEQFPLRGRQCSSEQIPTIALKFKDYHSFATSDLADIYGTKNLENAYHLQATTFESVYIKNKGDGEFEVHPLPTLAQISNINDLLVDDFDEDGYLDIILAGNLHDAEIETPRNDASLGLFLKGDGKGNFEAVDMAESGLYLPGNVRDLSVIRVGEGQQRGILVGVNEGRVQFILKNTEGTAF